MKKILLLLIVLKAMQPAFSQGTFKIANGTALKSRNGAHIIINNMNLINNGAIQQGSNDGTFIFKGANNVTIGGNGTTIFNQLELAKAANSFITLQSNLQVDSEVLFTSGLINLDKYILNLGTQGVLKNESEASRAYTGDIGYIQATGNLINPSTVDLGNLGAIISSGSNLGNTIIRRGHAIQNNVYGSNNSIQRYYDILPANNTSLNAILRFQYFNSELNGVEKMYLSQWKSTDNIMWTALGFNNRDSINKYVEKNGINDFARITLSKATSTTLICPVNITVNNDAGKCSAVINLTGNNSATVAGIPSPAIVYKIGNNIISTPYTFPSGTTIVTAIASNGIWNDTSCNFNVMVTDNEKPTITAAANVSVNNDAGQCSATVTLAAPATGDNCGVQSVGNDHPSTTYPVGTTTVTWTVTDIHGNINMATQTVMVTDNEKPTFTRPADKTIYTTASCTYDAGTAATGDVTNEHDNCSIGLQATFTDVTVAGACEGSKIISRTWHLADNNGKLCSSDKCNI